MKKLQAFILSRRGMILLIVSGVLTAAICLLMNAVLIPAIERTTQGVRCFDMNFAYDYETAQRFSELLSAEGKTVYLTRQLPLDFVYPMCYFCFFSCAVVRLRRKPDGFVLLPLLLAITDVTENVCIEIMLRAETLSRPLVFFAGCVTTTKTVLMYVCFLMLAVLLIRRLYLKSKVLPAARAGQDAAGR
ncbi:MAG: hypothetical protein IJT27_02420 [Clostridia bacterium]|nr:hypothetical protein [Clostridia bacterium]